MTRSLLLATSLLVVLSLLLFSDAAESVIEDVAQWAYHPRANYWEER